MRVLVLGAGGPAGWNFAHALGADRDIEVIGADVDPIMLELAATNETLVLPPVTSRPAALLNHIIRSRSIDVVHAQPDAEVRWLAEHDHEIGAATLLPSLDAIDICADKLATALALGRELAPRSYGASAAALDRLGGEAWMRLRSGAGSMGALPVRSHAVMNAWIEHWHHERGVTAAEWMLAEILPGRDLSWTGVFVDGELQASATKERMRLMGAERSPANVASTATVQRIVRRPDVHTRCCDAVQLIDTAANGVWMIDLREDHAGRPRITEINCGRFGTTSLFWHETRRLRWSLPRLYVELAAGGRLDGAPVVDACQTGAMWLRQPDMGCILKGARAGAARRDVVAELIRDLQPQGLESLRDGV